MIIQIKGSSNRGWRKYVTYGTDKKPRDPSKVKILKGDLLQGDRIANLTDYKENSYLIILSFKGRVSGEVVRSVTDEFEENFMMGFEKYEYHLDAVWHRDTDDDHVHIRIPKMNLKTQTQLQLYFDKKDRSRVNAIRDYLDVKYELESPLDNRPLVKEDRDFYIDNWRKKFGNTSFKFSDKKSRVKIEQSITQAVLEMHQAELLDSFDDVKNFIEEQGGNITKVGYDKPKDFHYLTIENESGKMRIKGEIYNEKFWCDSREDREEQIRNNKRNSPVGGKDKRGFGELKQKLENYNSKRKEIDKQYKPARQKAQKRAEERKEETLKSVKLYEQKGHLYSLFNLILLIILIIVTSFTLYQYQGSDWIIPKTYQIEQNGTLFVVIPKIDLSETKDEESVYFILKEKS